jgi:TRAP-type C4-dicarboxylate transport system permease small subunit
VIKQFDALTRAIGALLFAALLLVFAIQIIARFFFNAPLAWTDELAVMLYIWLIFWSASVLLTLKEHVVFDLLINALNPHFKRMAARTVWLLLLGLSLSALPASWDYISFMQREPTPVLGVPFFWVYLPFLLLLISIVVRCLAALITSFRQHQEPR